MHQKRAAAGAGFCLLLAARSGPRSEELLEVRGGRSYGAQKRVVHGRVGTAVPLMILCGWDLQRSGT